MAKISIIQGRAVIDRQTTVKASAHRSSDDAATLRITGDHLAMEVRLNRREIDRLVLELRTIGTLSAAHIARDVFQRVFTAPMPSVKATCRQS